MAARGLNFRDPRAEALHLLEQQALDDDESITEIAHRLGYSETSAFTRAFKRLEGCSQRAYLVKPG